jgi:hypothetical protein
MIKLEMGRHQPDFVIPAKSRNPGGWLHHQYDDSHDGSWANAARQNFVAESSRLDPGFRRDD